jgi:hypothetical protein
MKRATLFLTAASIALVANSAALGGEIYTWTDEDGGVHYQDRPTEAQAANAVVALVDIDSRNTDNAAITAQTQARLEAKAAAAQVESEAPAKMTRQEKDAEKEKRHQQCQTHRGQLDQYLRSRALYNEGADGVRIYQDEAQRQTTIDRVQAQINEYCGS